MVGVYNVAGKGNIKGYDQLGVGCSTTSFHHHCSAAARRTPSSVCPDSAGQV
ncbi:hypothetical protein AG1IA_05830 [Rhizoctonia solani AG-1 IA]|uniref:Uncharacterized protein n=1 Tax=Thanatephorus cucumeris (strain AG1-IA) TaxID=983506 RepID=L8WTN0_THACA|nr:hypothetical protein AG1IA_05830 [Rhizoctonia solani AG-1 IA]